MYKSYRFITRHIFGAQYPGANIILYNYILLFRDRGVSHLEISHKNLVDR